MIAIKLYIHYSQNECLYNQLKTKFLLLNDSLKNNIFEMLKKTLLQKIYIL